MSATEKYQRVSIEDYLAGELVSQVKHEYVGGVVHAMAGASNRHNDIVVNILGTLFAKLRGKKCRPYNSDTKVRIRQQNATRFYYPDAMIVCRQNHEADTFQDDPAVIVEVTSESTRRIDEGEKKESYLTIPSLCAYLLVEQDEPAVQVFRRTGNGFVREIYTSASDVIALPEVGTDLPVAEIYEGVSFPAASAET